MSITIQPRCGTPFDQFSREIARPPAPVPRPKVAPKIVVVAARERIRPEAPARSILQRMTALERANEVRMGRAQLKRDIRTGREQIAVLLLDPPACIETAKVAEVMLAVPKYGPGKVNKILASCRISLSKTMGGLSPRQRLELVELMGRG